jgi:Ion channel
VGPYAYGWLLALLVASLFLQLAASDDDWSRLATVALQSLALVAAFRISAARPSLVRLVTAAAILAILASIGVLIGNDELDKGVARAISLLLMVLATGAVVVGIVRQVRLDRGVTVRTMFGVLCIYLLVGMAFASSYGVIDALGDDPFFEQIRGGTQSDFVYFSFATVTTTGWGDLTAGAGLGRSFAVGEALFGQIYLVTVVALIVGNLGRRRLGEPAMD